MFTMRYIENYELREWVKENLRKAIFHKAHALAVQTGCEILVKLQDDIPVSDSDATKNCYYATDRLGKSYTKRGVHKEPGEIAISGDTGLPIVSMVDRGIQSRGSSVGTSPGKSDEDDEVTTEPDTNDVLSKTNDNELTALKDSGANTTSTEMNSTTPAGTDSDQDNPVPMQLSLTCTTETSDSLIERLTATDDATTTTIDQQQNIKQEANKDVDVTPIKIEVIDDDDDDTGSLQMTSEHIDMVDEMVDSSSLGQSYIVETPLQTNYPVPMSPKPYQCGMCQKAFRSIQVLQKHTQTFHQRAQQTVTARSRGRGYVSGSMGKRSQHQFQVPSSAAEQQRFPCVMCNRNFRHPALLEDHMNRSHMGHASLLQQSNASSSKSLLQTQLTQGGDSSAGDNANLLSADPSLPKITSVASLQQIIPQSSPGGSASTRSAPFTQGSPMSPVYRFQGPGPSTSAGPSSSQSRAQGVSPNRTVDEPYPTELHDQSAEFTPVDVVTESGHRIQQMSYKLSDSGQFAIQEKECDLCSNKDGQPYAATSYECVVCDLAVCQNCIDDHIAGVPKKMKHSLQKIGFLCSSGRRRRRDCWHCSRKGGSKRRRTTMECTVCDVGVCIDCEAIHLHSQLEIINIDK